MSTFGTIQDPTALELLKRRLNTWPGASSLAPEVMPTWELSRFDIETGFLAGVMSCGGLALGSAVAGQFVNFQLRNPVASGILVIVEEFSLRAASASEIVGGILEATADRATLTRTGPRDARQRIDGITTTTTQARLSHDTTNPASVTTAANGQFYQNNGTTQTWHRIPYLLRPGTALVFSMQTNNTAAQLCITWRERRAQPSELV